MKRLVIVDDEILVLRGIQVMLKKLEADLEVVGTATDGAAGLALIRETQPDVVLTDIRMPGMSGLEMIEEAQKSLPGTVFVVISGYQEFEYARRSMELGVRDYIDKPITREKLQRLIGRLEAMMTAAGSPEAERKAMHQTLRLARKTLVQMIQENRTEGYEEQVEAFLRTLKKNSVDLEEYKTACYQMVMNVSESFYEQWKQYERHDTLPSFQNVEQMATREEVDEYVRMILGYLFEKTKVRKMGNAQRKMTEILNYIHENYARDLGLHEIAEAMGMSQTYISILFKDEVGTSFVKYLTALRMDHAKELLLQGYKVAEVSKRVGYSNYRYFCNVFKRETGVTPNKYRGN